MDNSGLLFSIVAMVWLGVSQSSIYTDKWAIKIEGGEHVARKIADKHGFIYIGKIMEDYYHFQHRNISKRSLYSSSFHHRSLLAEQTVHWVQQQEVRKRDKRHILQQQKNYDSKQPNDPKWEKMWYLNLQNSVNMNVMRVWNQNITGEGVVVTIIDDGIERNHPDLQKNYDELASYDVNSQDEDPMPRYDHSNTNRHGTRCAGVVAAQRDNGVCGVGVAYDARIGGIRMLDGTVTDLVEAQSLSLNPNYVDIFTISWGPDDDGRTVDGPGQLARKAIYDGVHKMLTISIEDFLTKATKQGPYNNKLRVTVIAVDIVRSFKTDKVLIAAVADATMVWNAAVFDKTEFHRFLERKSIIETVWKPDSRAIIITMAVLQFIDQGLRLKDQIEINVDNDGSGDLISLGRNGLGSIFVWSSGNGGRYGDDCNCDGYVNSIHTISINSVTEHGMVPWYAESCSSILASTYSSGSSYEKQIITTDIRHTCTESHTGTSGSAALASGISALVLQANPKLTWRDLQHIIVLTAKRKNLEDMDWKLNGVNRYVSNYFGYGLMDAQAMVNLAKTWSTLADQHICEVRKLITKNLVAKGYGKLAVPLFTDGCASTANYVQYLEHVQARITLTATLRGKVKIFLTSPASTRSTLLRERVRDTSQAGFNNWLFMTTHNWGEEARGQWILEIESLGIDVELKEFVLVLMGTSTRPQNVRTENRDAVLNCTILYSNGNCTST